ncbi:MAG: hypothetical protein WCV90_03300 [Candidatus Woesearchaeota archaeon]
MTLVDQIKSVKEVGPQGRIVSFNNDCDVGFQEGPTGLIFGVMHYPFPEMNHVYHAWPINATNGEHEEFSRSFREESFSFWKKKYGKESDLIHLEKSIGDVCKAIGFEYETERDWGAIAGFGLLSVLSLVTFPIGVKAALSYRNARRKGHATGSGDAWGIPIGLTIGAPLLFYNRLVHGDHTGNVRVNLPDEGENASADLYEGDPSKFKALLLHLEKSGDILIGQYRRPIVKGDYLYQARELDREHFEEVASVKPDWHLPFGLDPRLDERLSQNIKQYDAQLKKNWEFAAFLKGNPEEAVKVYTTLTR